MKFREKKSELVIRMPHFRGKNVGKARGGRRGAADDGASAAARGGAVARGTVTGTGVYTT